MMRSRKHTIYSSHSHQRGFSIVELMTAVVVLAILIAVAVPSYTSFIANSQIRTTAESITNGISTARAEAVKRNAQIIFILNNDTSWQIGCVIVVVGVCPAIIQAKAAKEGANGSVSLIITGANNLIFTSLGTVLNIPGQLGAVEVDSTTIPATDSKELRVVVNGSSVKMCDPSVIAADDPRRCI